jgi:hypothetical protein
MKIFIILVLLVINIPIYKTYYRLMFRDAEDFKDSIKYSFTPDLFSLFKGEYGKDRFAEMKLSLFYFLCFITVMVEFFIINSFLNLFN